LVLGALNVATYLEKKEDVVSLDVRFGTLGRRHELQREDDVRGQGKEHHSRH
jgi:hypothetical protein